MTQEHPITPPPEVLDKLTNGPGFWTERIVRAFQAGADQELEACCEWVNDNFDYCNSTDRSDWLRAARRPKPPSLKELALKSLKDVGDACDSEGFCLSNDINTIRRALESLPD